MTIWLTEGEIKALRESKRQIQAYLKDKWKEKQSQPNEEKKDSDNDKQ